MYVCAMHHYSNVCLALARLSSVKCRKRRVRYMLNAECVCTYSDCQRRIANMRALLARFVNRPMPSWFCSKIITMRCFNYFFFYIFYTADYIF